MTAYRLSAQDSPPRSSFDVALGRENLAHSDLGIDPLRPGEIGGVMKEMPEKQPLVSSETELSLGERQELEALESTIERNFHSFLEVGFAL